MTMSIDASTHSLFGFSKTAADLLVQEYGRYFDIPTACFRGGWPQRPPCRRPSRGHQLGFWSARPLVLAQGTAPVDAVKQL
jgi:nucleoside-diphosphate-sugar epimerase